MIRALAWATVVVAMVGIVWGASTEGDHRAVLIAAAAAGACGLVALMVDDRQRMQRIDAGE